MKKLITLVLLLGSMTGFAQKYTLGLNLKVGETHYMNVNAKVQVAETINGAEQNIITTITAKMAFKVLAVKDTGYTVETKYETMAMQLDAGGRTMHFDSEDKDTSNIFTKIMSSIINRPFTMELTRRGRVLSVTGSEELYAHMFDKIPAVPEAEKAKLTKQLDQGFGPSAIKGNMEEAFAIFPGAPVAKNDHWAVSIAIKSILSVNINTTFTLTDVTNDAYVLHSEGSSKPADDTGYKQLNGYSMKFSDVSAVGTSDIRLDKTTGWVLQQHDIRTLKTTVNIADSPQTPGGMLMPMTATIETTTTGK